jgi:tetratricopeptide (TPR) repeat protein
LVGNWDTIKEYDNDLVNENLRLGEIWGASQHFHWHCLPKIYQGHLESAKSLVNRLNDVFKEYENDFTYLLIQLLNTGLLLQSRKLQDALIEIEKGIQFGQKTEQNLFLVYIYSCKAWIHILSGDIEKAEKSLKHANIIRREIDPVPWQVCGFFRSQLECALYRLKESIENGKRKESFIYRKKAVESSKMLLKLSKKVPQHRVESYRLKGVYYWLINKQKKAFKWWHKAIKEGERLGARLELSRTYFEVGKSLLEAKNSYKVLNGLRAEDYLEKARALFKEMDLQWDLEALSRVYKG